ncbi:MAG: tetratricopeptide repeat protein [Candidatus Eremiobacteraeota bacterium]|nr:tetratricopeptide repeat protein [Candidatus Eremiobacteraeota bacterium]MBC5827376.1 tetratricopeptide repeat protein [Candidatus Eremiobacteraeota bacterium]
MNSKTVWLIAASALVALAVWPAFFLKRHADADAIAFPTPAPVIADYLSRGRLVAFYEKAVRRNPNDQIMARMLAGQYLQRYRETGDVGDLSRADRAARRSLAVQPRYNIGAESELSTIFLTFHENRQALAYAADVSAMEPWNASSKAAVASLDMELGDYAAARRILSAPAPRYGNPGWDSALARYDELTGRLAAARRLIDGAMAQTDSVIDNPAEGRAWYHWRAGQLAFKAGDLDAAEQRYREALAIFPSYARADDGLAQLYWGQRRWSEALDAATRGADLIPLPTTLGYKADAQRALGEARGADETQDLIGAIQRLGNAKGINDRLIANYYSEHGTRLGDAVAIARRDMAKRDDIYSEDTLAWALAMSGRWTEASPHAERAVRYGTQDSLLQYHAGMIALRRGQRQKAAARLSMALSLNRYFHPFYAAEAEQALGTLSRFGSVSINFPHHRTN